jgi:alkylation response protein AidB-like acyl-CoA dehydrogenase
MDWDDSPQEAAFRAEVRAFIGESLPALYRDEDVKLRRRPPTLGASREYHKDRLSDEPARREAALAWRDALRSRGWIVPQLTKERGGAELSGAEQFILAQELLLVDAPPVRTSRALMVANHGSEILQKEYVPRMLAADMLISEGLSEPSSGSDLASLQTRAEQDGDEFVLNGRKIWTSGAHFADAMFVLARTDPSVPKHRGLSMFLLDMKTPGISIQPLPNMAFAQSFNEVLFEDVRIPATHLMGGLNEGWRVVVGDLDEERISIVGGDEMGRFLKRVYDYAREAATPRPAAETRRALADCFIALEVHRQFELTIVSLGKRGEPISREPSIHKLFGSELWQRVTLTGMRVLGLRGQLYDADDDRAPLRAMVPYTFLYAIPATIAGGASEIQRNIIATRGLGLPRG